MKVLILLGIKLLGVFGLSLALLYLTAVVVAFLPGFDWVTNFLVGPSDRDFSYMFLLAALPYVMLTLHLYLRTIAGKWLLESGHVEDARKYSAERLSTGVLRSKREALMHRLVLGRSLVAQGKYEEAEAVLAEIEPATLPTALRIPYARWRLEAALRREDLIAARAAIEAAGANQPQGDDGAAFWACRAELAARKRDRTAFREAVEASEWGAPAHPRLAHAEAVMVLRSGAPTDDDAALGRRLEAGRATLDAEIPGRAAEIDALLAFLAGERADISELGGADPRARHVVESLAQSME